MSEIKLKLKRKAHSEETKKKMRESALNREKPSHVTHGFAQATLNCMRRGRQCEKDAIILIEKDTEITGEEVLKFAMSGIVLQKNFVSGLLLTDTRKDCE